MTVYLVYIEYQADTPSIDSAWTTETRAQARRAELVKEAIDDGRIVEGENDGEGDDWTPDWEETIHVHAIEVNE